MRIFLTFMQVLTFILMIFWCWFYIQNNIADMAMGAAQCLTGVVFGIALVADRLKGQAGKISAIERKQEKDAIDSTESQAKVKVLEAKIETLEKALENALNNK